MSKAKAVKKNPDERKRQIGSRTETVERVLTPVEVEDHQERLLSLLGDKQTAEEQKKAAGSEYAAKINRAKADITDTLETLRKRRVKEQITVEEWLTAGNEVIRINAATGEQIGARNARADELQESLPFDDVEPVQDGPEILVGDEADNVVAGDFGNASELH
jgi:hypothetical protein